jgi:4-amino-4-deoxy-L-arabinose transferase-like glycosyltransferase
VITAKKHPIWLYIILVGYFLIGTIYVVVNPLWEAPDEIHHFAMVQYLQTHGLQLPSQAPGTVGLWQQEGNQPPLYYLLGAILISPIDTSDINNIMRVNPHADIGVIRPDGNVNRIVHLPDKGFPGNGSILATYILRFFSLFLGGCTVYVTYLIGREVFPDKPEVVLAAAGLHAFLPMYLYISASVNNDNLSNLLANLLVLLLIRLIQVKETPAYQSYLLLGVVTGAGLLSKLNIGLLIPVIALVLLLTSIRLRDWRPLIFGGLISGSATIVIAGWWYYRNLALYGDPSALDRFLDIVGRRAVPADLAQLWTERTSFIRTFWGLFGSINVPMNETLYIMLEWLTKLSLISLIIFFGYSTWRHVSKPRITGEHTGSPLQLSPVMLSLLWAIMTFIALLRWTSITPASQGRLVYSAISSIMLWFAVALLWWIPQKWRGWIAGVWVICFAIVAAVQPFVTIAPAYAVPEQIESEAVQAIFTANTNQIAVHETEIHNSEVHPGSYVEITVDFEALTTFDRNWSIFVHLVTTDEIIIGQRDMYPGRGLLATSDMQAGYNWRNPIAIFVPATAYTPNTVEVRLGWYDLATGQRMSLENGAEMLTIGTVNLLPSLLSDLPNPQQINFGNLIELIGYDISTLHPASGDTVELTLYWRALQPLEQDYVVFAHILDPQTFTKYAESNAMPMQWTRPTSTWAVGEIVEDTHTLTVIDNAAGMFPIEIGLYLQQEGFPRLGVIGTYDNYVYLTPVRIESASE